MTSDDSAVATMRPKRGKSGRAPGCVKHVLSDIETVTGRGACLVGQTSLVMRHERTNHQAGHFTRSMVGVCKCAHAAREAMFDIAPTQFEICSGAVGGVWAGVITL